MQMAIKSLSVRAFPIHLCKKNNLRKTIIKMQKHLEQNSEIFLNKKMHFHLNVRHLSNWLLTLVKRGKKSHLLFVCLSVCVFLTRLILSPLLHFVLGLMASFVTLSFSLLIFSLFSAFLYLLIPSNVKVCCSPGIIF